MSSKKGQIWSTDFTAGVLVLAFILLFFILIWNGLAVRWNNANEYRQMQTDAVFASEALMTTSGEPNSWEMMENINESSAIGLVNGRNELSNEKITKLVAGNDSYYFVKEKLGVQRYELGIQITDLENTTYYEFGEFPGELDTSVIFERFGILNESPVIVHVEVWK